MILLIDTTTNPTAIGIWDGKKLQTKTIESSPENNRKLISIIQSFLNAKSYKLQAIEVIGVINGPGTFTGARTGVTIANTMAYALEIPIYAVDTLTAQVTVGAGLAPAQNKGQPQGLPLQSINNAISLLSASNSEVYFARFNQGKMEPARIVTQSVAGGGKIEIVNVENNLKNRLKKGDIIFGDLKCEHAQLLKDHDLRIVTSKERIESLLQMIIDNKIRPQKMALPIYIKKPNITKSNKKKLS